MLDQILVQENKKTNNQFENEKRSLGCSWADLTKNCQHGDSCPLIDNILGLSTFFAKSTLTLPSSRAFDAGKKFVLKIIPKGQQQAIQQRLIKIQPPVWARVLGIIKNLKVIKRFFGPIVIENQFEIYKIQ